MTTQNKPTSLKLTSTNYYDHDTDWQYMSVSIFKNFVDCEAATLAKLKSEDNQQTTEVPLLVGNYVHSFFESEEAHKQFVAANKPYMFTKSGNSLLRPFQVAETMIDRLKNDDFFNFVYQGEKESIVTGDLYGIPWKGKIDCLNVEQGYFVDLKTSADIHKRIWSKRHGGYVPFVSAYGYVLQMWVYKRLLEQQYGKPFTPYIFAVSKQDPPDIAAIKIDESRYPLEDKFIRLHLPRVLAVMNGEIAPHYCGICPYCRKNKQLHQFIEVDRLID
jgi:hypothetical protein